MFEMIRKKRPIVHCITNYVTVNDCANLLLAAGASPLMADELAEIEEITALSKALLLNVGTLNQRTFAAMLTAGKAANARGIPVILDPVGAGASHFRTESVKKLLDELHLTVLKGNRSELKAVADGVSNPGGIDAVPEESGSETGQGGAETLARRYRCIVVMTGAVDLVTDGSRSIRIANGDARMARITGSGCMLGALIGAAVAAVPDAFAATAAAVAAMGIAGARAAVKTENAGQGTASFRTALIDEISLMDDATIKKEATYVF